MGRCGLRRQRRGHILPRESEQSDAPLHFGQDEASLLAETISRSIAAPHDMIAIIWLSLGRLGTARNLETRRGGRAGGYGV